MFAPRKARGALLGFRKFRAERKATLRREFNKFEPVTPWIFGVGPARARKIIIVDNLHTPGAQRFAQFVQLEDREGRVRFLGCLKIPLHSDMQLLRTALKPAASARAQGRRLLDLFHPEDRAIEIPRRGFTSFRRRDLNVIDARHAWIHTTQNSMIGQGQIFRPVVGIFRILPSKRTSARRVAASGQGRGN